MMQPPSRIISRFDEIDSQHAKQFETDRFRIIWDGLLYDTSGDSEELAVARFADSLAAGGDRAELAADLRGSYFITVLDLAARESFSFVDANGMFSAYRGVNATSRSFLDLLQLEKVSKSDLLPDRLIEFMHLGNVYFGDTYAPTIKKIAANELVVVRDSGVEVLPKPIRQITDPPVYVDFFDATEVMANAAKQRRLSLDLSGGFDSRFLCCLMSHHGVDYETSLSGFPGHIDHELGKEAARLLGSSYHFSHWDSSALDGDLDPVLRRMDGLCGLMSVCHRLSQMTDERRERGVDWVFKGLGGALYKDFFWMQDFPNYWSKKINMARLHRLRFEIELLTRDLLTDEYFQVFQEARHRRVERLNAYRLSNNSRSYDNVYFQERIRTWNSRTQTSIQRFDIPTHAPMCEIECVQIAFDAPRMKRVYNRLHREYITRHDKQVARARTTDGTSASSELPYLVRDAFGFASGRFRRLMKKLNQVLRNSTKFKSPPLVDSARIVDHPTGQAALAELKQHGIIRDSVNFADVSPRFQEHMVVLGWVLGQLEN